MYSPFLDYSSLGLGFITICVPLHEGHLEQKDVDSQVVLHNKHLW
jgi:hypothetical protein